MTNSPLPKGQSGGNGGVGGSGGNGANGAAAPNIQILANHRLETSSDTIQYISKGGDGGNGGNGGKGKDNMVRNTYASLGYVSQAQAA